MNKPISVPDLPEIQQKLKTELASHVVRQKPISADDLYRI